MPARQSSEKPGTGNGANPAHVARFHPGKEEPLAETGAKLGRAPRTRLTKAGWMLCLLSVGIGMAAYNTYSNVLYLTLALLLSSLLLSGILSWLNFYRSRWKIIVDPHLQVGNPAAVRLEVRNAKKRLPSIGLKFHMYARRAGQGVVLPVKGSLGGSERTTLDWVFTPRHRGLEIVEMPGVESLFPFGFLRKGLPGATPPREVLVWPARVDYTFELKCGRQVRQIGGEALKRGPGAEMLGLRHYRHGDSLRSVHWKTSARTGRLLVRETAQEQNAGFSMWVGADLDTWASEAQFEQMCAFAGSLAEDLFRSDSLALAGVEGLPLLPVRSLADVHAFLDSLARLKRSASPTPALAAHSHPLIEFKPGVAGRVLATIDGDACGEA